MNRTLNKPIKFKKMRSLIIVLFLIYLLILLKLILFKYPIRMTMEVIQSHENISLYQKIMNSNLIPLKTISYYLGGNQGILVARDNILGNIIAFSPLGFFLPIIFKRLGKVKAIVFSSFILSLTFEIIQLLTQLGSFDVDDIILNVLGGFFGFIIYKVIVCLFCEKKKTEKITENEL